MHVKWALLIIKQTNEKGLTAHHLQQEVLFSIVFEEESRQVGSSSYPLAEN